MNCQYYAATYDAPQEAQFKPEIKMLAASHALQF